MTVPIHTKTGKGKNIFNKNRTLSHLPVSIEAFYSSVEGILIEHYIRHYETVQLLHPAVFDAGTLSVGLRHKIPTQELANRAEKSQRMNCAATSKAAFRKQNNNMAATDRRNEAEVK